MRNFFGNLTYSILKVKLINKHQKYFPFIIMATGGSLRPSIYGASDSLDVFYCTTCAYNTDNINEAETYCVICEEFYCVNCARDHKKFSKMRSHKILNKEEMEEQVLQQTPWVIAEKCQIHHGNKIDTYCLEHQTVGCVTCIALHHGSCKGTSLIPNEAKDFKINQECKESKQAIKTSYDDLTQFKKSLQADLEDNDKEKTAALELIKDFRKSIEKELDRLEKNTTDEVNDKHRILQHEIHANIHNIEDKLESLKCCLGQLENTKECSDAKVYVYVKAGKVKMSEATEMLDNIESCYKRGTIKYKENISINKVLKNHEKLGEITEERYTNFPELPNNQMPETARIQNESNIRSMSLTCEVNVQTRKDKKTCNITGCTFLGDETLLMADNENGKLKRLNRSYLVTDCCDLPCYGICATSDKEVAVSLPMQKKIQYVSIGKKLKLTRSFLTTGICAGLAARNTNLIVSNHESNDLHIYDNEGQCLNTLIMKTTSDIVFPYIALSSDNSRIYFTNESRCVIVMNIKDGHQFYSSPQQISSARGLSILKNDDILVADFASDKIVQLTSDGQLVGTIKQWCNLSKGPHCVCVDNSNLNLIVAFYKSNTINIYKFEH